MIRSLLAMLVTYGAILLVLQLVPTQQFLSGFFVWVVSSSWVLVAAVGGIVCALTSRDRPIIKSVFIVAVGIAIILAHSTWGEMAESVQYMALIGVKSVAVAAAAAFCVAAIRRNPT